MNRIVGLLYAISCFATSWISGSMLGVGMWFWIIIGSGVFVAFSQFFPIIRDFGAIVALLIGIISIIAVLLGLAAATIGGSFKLDNDELLLLLSFFLVAVFGFTLVKINKYQNSARKM